MCADVPEPSPAPAEEGAGPWGRGRGARLLPLAEESRLREPDPGPARVKSIGDRDYLVMLLKARVPASPGRAACLVASSERKRPSVGPLFGSQTGSFGPKCTGGFGENSSGAAWGGPGKARPLAAMVGVAWESSKVPANNQQRAGLRRWVWAHLRGVAGNGTLVPDCAPARHSHMYIQYTRAHGTCTCILCA